MLKLEQESSESHSITLKGDTTLMLSATFVDTIAEVGPGLLDSDSSELVDGVVEEICQLWTNCHKCVDLLVNSSFVVHPYSQYRIYQSLPDVLNSISITDRDFDISTWLQNLDSFRFMSDTTSLSGRDRVFAILQSMDEVTQQIESYCGGRKLFVSQSGWIGLCPPGTHESDTNRAVRGVFVPIILRRRIDNTISQYHLVGRVSLSRAESWRFHSAEMMVEIL